MLGSVLAAAGQREEWRVVFTTARSTTPPGVHPLLDEFRDIPAREARAHIPVGTPILINPRNALDDRLIDFFATSLTFTTLSELSRRTYAIEIKTWLSFLWAQGVEWVDATERHFGAFLRWRTDPRINPAAVSGATWNKAVAALTLLSSWAVSQGHMPRSPIPTAGRGRSRWGARSTNAKAQRNRWVTPRTYRVWRDVGLRGYTLAAGQGNAVVADAPDSSWRGRQAQRNAAFTDLMFTSALRRRELATLLVVELPAVAGTETPLAPAVAKNRQRRMWTPIGGPLADTHAYIHTARRAAVLRAQREGRYDGGDRILVRATSWTARGKLLLVYENGGDRAVDDIAEDERARLMLRTESGPEPLMVWLGESGTPMMTSAWNDIFEAANRRVASHFGRLGRGGGITLSPHSLRFSFALYVLAALHRRIDQRNGYASTGPYDERRYEQAYDIVRDLLGHRHSQITKDTYLEPVKGLRAQVLLGETGEVEELLAVLATRDARVLDVGGA